MFFTNFLLFNCTRASSNKSLAATDEVRVAQRFESLCNYYYGPEATMKDFHKHVHIILQKENAQFLSWVTEEIPKLQDLVDVYGPISLYECTDFNEASHMLQVLLIEIIKELQDTMSRMGYFKNREPNNEAAIRLYVELEMEHFTFAKNQMEGYCLLAKNKTGVKENEDLEDLRPLFRGFWELWIDFARSVHYCYITYCKQ